MNFKKITAMATVTFALVSCLVFTTCNFPVTEDEDDLPLDEWVVLRVEYLPNFRTPNVEVFFSNGLHGNGYRKEGATEDWLSKLVSIPGLELGNASLLTASIIWSVKSQTAADGEPLTACFSQEEFIERDGEVWDRKDVTRVRIKPESISVTIIE